MGFFDFGKKSAQQNPNTPMKTNSQMSTSAREQYNAGVAAGKAQQDGKKK